MDQKRINEIVDIVIKNLNYTEYKKLNMILTRIYDKEINKSIYSLKIDTSQYSNIDYNTLL
ncbi:MAG: hypothetical protein ACTTGJ_02210 [Clostridium sp.]